MPLAAVHIKTDGFRCEICPEVVRKALIGVDGVKDVVAMASLHLTSALYDPSIVHTDVLTDRLHRCGFTTHDIPPS